MNLTTFPNRAALRRWLEDNHLSERECWVASYRSKQSMPDALPYLDVVEEALCFGWIDSTVKKMDDGRLAQRISPRRKNSHWTERNIQRCQVLERRGLMTDSGIDRIIDMGRTVMSVTGDASCTIVIQRLTGKTVNS